MGRGRIDPTMKDRHTTQKGTTMVEGQKGSGDDVERGRLALPCDMPFEKYRTHVPLVLHDRTEIRVLERNLARAEKLRGEIAAKVAKSIAAGITNPSA